MQRIYNTSKIKINCPDHLGAHIEKKMDPNYANIWEYLVASDTDDSSGTVVDSPESGGELSDTPVESSDAEVLSGEDTPEDIVPDIVDEIRAFNFARLGVLIRRLTGDALKNVIQENLTDDGPWQMLYPSGRTGDAPGKPPQFGENMIVSIGEVFTTIDKRAAESLWGRRWVDMNVLSYYLQLVADAPNKLRVGVKSVKAEQVEKAWQIVAWDRWTLAYYEQHLDKLLLPVFKDENHFTLLVANFRDHQVRYYESHVGGSEQHRADGEAILNVITGKENGWRGEYVTSAPQQVGTRDCGVFVARVAVLEAFDIPVTRASVTQAKVDLYRRAMWHDIITQRFTG